MLLLRRFCACRKSSWARPGAKLQPTLRTATANTLDTRNFTATCTHSELLSLHVVGTAVIDALSFALKYATSGLLPCLSWSTTQGVSTFKQKTTCIRPVARRVCVLSPCHAKIVPSQAKISFSGFEIQNWTNPPLQLLTGNCCCQDSVSLMKLILNLGGSMIHRCRLSSNMYPVDVRLDVDYRAWRKPHTKQHVVVYEADAHIDPLGQRERVQNCTQRARVMQT